MRDPSVQHLEENLEQLRVDMRAQVSGVRSDIKEMTAALRDLIRLEGETKRINDALLRIGKQVDDHEGRLRAVFERLSKQNTRGALTSDGLRSIRVWGYMAASAGLTWVLTYIAEHVK